VPEALEGITLCLLEKDPERRFSTARAVCNALDAALGRPLGSTAPGASQAVAMPAMMGGATDPSVSGGRTDPALPTDPTIAASHGGGGGGGSYGGQGGSYRPVPTTLGGVLIAGTAAVAIVMAASGGGDASSGSGVASGAAANSGGGAAANSGGGAAANHGGGAAASGGAGATAGGGASGASNDPAAPATPTFGLDFLAGYEVASGSKFTAYASAGAWDSAAADFEQASAQADAPARWKSAAKTCRGYAAVHGDDFAKGRALLDEAIALDATWAIPHLGLAGVLSGLGENERAIEAAHAAQRLAPKWWMTVAAEARVHRRAAAYDRAIEQYRRALQIAPAEPVLLAELALVYHATHLDTEAERYARDALAIDPDMVAAHLLLAERALERRDAKEALAEANRVVALEPESATGRLARADALSLLGKKSEAKNVYTELIALIDRTNDKTVDPKRVTDIRTALEKGQLPIARGERKRSARSNRRSGTTKNDPINDMAW
jgi:tetratricopeptide (TPR) repeat protein